MKILVVDDEEMIREVIKEYSINEGFIVEEADNGRDAVFKVKNNDYDLIIFRNAGPVSNFQNEYRLFKEKIKGMDRENVLKLCKQIYIKNLLLFRS